MRAKKLVWTEGLFITQHHLQQLDRYHEQLLHERLSAYTPYGWGILGDRDRRSRARDGPAPAAAPARHLPRRHAHRRRRQLRRHHPSPPRRVHLDAPGAHPRRLPGHRAGDRDRSRRGISRPSRAASRASCASTARSSTSTSASGEHPLQYAKRNLRIILGDERQDALDLIRIAQLMRAPSGNVLVRDGFVPPVFASAPLLT